MEVHRILEMDFKNEYLGAKLACDPRAKWASDSGAKWATWVGVKKDQIPGQSELIWLKSRKDSRSPLRPSHPLEVPSLECPPDIHSALLVRRRDRNPHWDTWDHKKPSQVIASFIKSLQIMIKFTLFLFTKDYHIKSHNINNISVDKYCYFD